MNERENRIIIIYLWLFLDFDNTFCEYRLYGFLFKLNVLYESFTNLEYTIIIVIICT